MDGLGFEEDRVERLMRRPLYGDAHFILATESGKWTEKETEVYLFIWSKRFTTLLDRIFKQRGFRFADYEARKAINDRRGEIAGAMAEVCSKGRTLTLYSAAIHIDMRRLKQLLTQMESPEGFYKALYEAELGRFVVLVEGMWVYLFAAAEMQLTPEETLRRIREDAAVIDQARRWHVKKPIDLAVIERFFAEYRALFTGTRGSRI